jgi:hypothetical protein
MPSKCAQGQFYLYLYDIPSFSLEICPVGFVFGGRMKGLTFLRNVSHAFSYCYPNLTPSSVTISNQDYLVLAVTTQRPQSPTCGRDDRNLGVPHLRLLCYSPPTSLVYVSEPKALVPIFRPWKEVPRMAAAQTQHPSVYCYILLWPIPTNPKRLPLRKIIATRFRANKMPRWLEGTQEEESLRIWEWCKGGWSMVICSMASV